MLAHHCSKLAFKTLTMRGRRNRHRAFCNLESKIVLERISKQKIQTYYSLHKIQCIYVDYTYLVEG